MRKVRGDSTAVGRRKAVPVVTVRVSTALLLVMLNASASSRSRRVPFSVKALSARRSNTVMLSCRRAFRGSA